MNGSDPVPLGLYAANGNRFHIFQADRPPTPADVAGICADPPADGLIRLWQVGDHRARIELFNRDGSPAEYSGNGFSCALAALARNQGWEGNLQLVARIGTFSGWASPVSPERVTPEPTSPEATFPEPNSAVSAVRLGIPVRSLDPRAEPVPVADLPTDGTGHLDSLDMCAAHQVQMGNPHLLLEVRAWPDPAVLEALSPILDALRTRVGPDARGSNLSVVGREGPHDFRMQTWERGVGRSPACASAGVAAFYQLARSADASPARLHMPGGILSLRWTEDRDMIELVHQAHWIQGGRGVW